MGGIAFVFSGQGDQYPGMGKEFYEAELAAAAVFARCDAIRPGTSRQCFCGTPEELQRTDVTQPCLYAMELAASAALAAKNIRPDAVAGFSLGEIAAATYAGLYDLETGFRLVCTRGELMQQESAKHDTAMAAVLKLSEEQVRELAKSYSALWPVNFNCPGQITVSGLREEMTPFLADVKAAGGRGIPLKVSGAFHSPFMAPAAEAFAEELRKISLETPRIPLYSDLTANPYAGDYADLLSRQICSPVRWEAIIRNMIASGIATFVEIGPGKTLANLIRKINPSVKAIPVGDYLEEQNAAQ